MNDGYAGSPWALRWQIVQDRVRLWSATRHSRTPPERRSVLAAVHARLCSRYAALGRYHAYQKRRWWARRLDGLARLHAREAVLFGASDPWFGSDSGEALVGARLGPSPSGPRSDATSAQLDEAASPPADAIGRLR